MEELSHLDEEGNVKMVDVTNKTSNNRIAKAEGKITMLPETIIAIQSSSLPKGNVLTTAKIAGKGNVLTTANCWNISCKKNLRFNSNVSSIKPF